MSGNDYKYVIDSLYSVQVGAKYSYEELLENTDLSRKYRSIIREDLLREVDPSTTLESHLYYMKPDDEACKVYQKLKAKIRLYVPQRKKHLFGRESTEFEERLLSAEELASISPEQKEKMEIMIVELQLSKVGLMSYAV